MNNANAWEFPWLQNLLESLQRSQNDGTLAHAYIISGARGLGKEQIAIAIAAFLTCEAPNPQGQGPCGECKGCRLNATGNHPDVLLLAPKEPGKALTVDLIRKLSDYVHVSSHAGGARVAVLASAHKMNSSASNALLKTLEEPHESTYLFLVTDSPGLLSPTIRSRCQRITLPIPALEVSLEWMRKLCGGEFDEALATSCLKAAGGSPLLAMAMLTDESLPSRQALERAFVACLTGIATPESLLASLMLAEPITAIEQILSTTAHYAKLMLDTNQQADDGAIDTAVLGGLVSNATWAQFIEQISAVDADENTRRRVLLGNRLVRLYDEIEKARRQIDSPTNPNTKLLLESLCWLASRALK